MPAFQRLNATKHLKDIKLKKKKINNNQKVIKNEKHPSYDG